MFVNLDDFLGMGNRYGGTFTLLRGLSDFNGEARNMDVKWVSILGQIKKKKIMD